MIKHIVLWKLKGSEQEKPAIKQRAKDGLEGLVGKIDGLRSAAVYTQLIGANGADMMLESVFEDEAALRRYKEHPAHLAVANTFVRPFIEQRLSADYVI